MPSIPPRYSYLREEPIPPLMVRIALDMYGTVETPGSADNPVILGWADEVQLLSASPYNDWAADFYNDDKIPWCGLFMGVVAVRAGQGRPDRRPPDKYLAALSWRNWGEPAGKEDIQVGDVVVLARDGGGHVTLAVGVNENNSIFMGIGGNQSDQVCIAEFPIDRVVAVRRPPYENKPAGARRVVLSSTGVLSSGEQ
jgi:uncharacterized protein (TIGR02594 family)